MSAPLAACRPAMFHDLELRRVARAPSDGKPGHAGEEVGRSRTDRRSSAIGSAPHRAEVRVTRDETAFARAEVAHHVGRATAEHRRVERERSRRSRAPSSRPREGERRSPDPGRAQGAGLPPGAVDLDDCPRRSASLPPWSHARAAGRLAATTSAAHTPALFVRTRLPRNTVTQYGSRTAHITSPLSIRRSPMLEHDPRRPATIPAEGPCP